MNSPQHVNKAGQLQENEFFMYWHMLLRRKWIVILSLVICVTAALVISLKMRPVYRATAEILIEKERPASYSDRQEGVDIDTTNEDYYQTQYKTMKNRSIAVKVIEKLQLAREPEFAGCRDDLAGAFLRHIIVDPVHGSRLVNLSAEAHSPGLAAKMVNTLADVYVGQNLENRLFASKEMLKKMPSGISQADLARGGNLESIPAIVNNPLIQTMKSDLIKYKAEYANLSRRYKQKHPALASLGAQIEYLERQIDREMALTVNSVKNELSGGFMANNIRVTNYAEAPGVPVRPQRAQYLVIGVAFGIMLGFGLVLFVEANDNTVKTGSDVENYIGLSCLGVIPSIKTRDGAHVIVDEKHPNTLEALRLLRTNLVFSGAEGKLRTLLVTSCAPGAGKTFVSMNIASSFAQSARNTLLIDTDLRRATLTKSMKMGDARGLSNYLIGDASLDEIVYPAGKNLSIVPAGCCSPNPSELLGSEKFRELVREIKQRFNRVIIDSSPVLSVSDTLNISGEIDGTVLVVHCGKMSRTIVNAGKRKLQGVGANLIGVVLNRVNIKTMRDYAYYSYGDYY